MTETATYVESAQQEIAAVLAEAKTDAYVHARDIDSGEEFGYGADEGVILASVFKIPVVLQYAREVAAGTLDPTEHATVTAEFRSGGIGIGGCADDVTASWRDLALLMMSFSDNAATDFLYERLGLDNIVATLRGLGLEKTNLVRDCRGLFKTVYDDSASTRAPCWKCPPSKFFGQFPSWIPPAPIPVLLVRSQCCWLQSGGTKPAPHRLVKRSEPS